MRILACVLFLSACAGNSTETDTDDDTRSGACGDVTEHTLDVVVSVVDAGGAPVEGAAVALEETAWEPGVLGTASTDATGSADLGTLTLTSVEDCWGTVLDYRLTVSSGELSVEEGVNSSLYAAVSAGETAWSREVTLR